MIATHQITDIDQQFQELYHQSEEQLNKSSDAMNKHRAESFLHFQKLGLPSNKAEDYKYTNLQPYFKGTFEFNLRPQPTPSDWKDVFQCEVPQLQTHTVFVVNGWYAPQNQSNFDLPDGVFLGSLAEGAKKFPHLFEKHYGQIAPIKRDGLTAMNGCFAQDGVFIYIPQNTVLQTPLQVVNIMTGDTDKMIFQRNLIIAEQSSEAKVMICDHTLSTNKFVINTVTEIAAAENATIDCYNVQNQHNLTTQVGGYFVHQKAYSNVMTNNLTLHAGMARNNIVYTMDDEHCESHVYGLYLSDKNQHIDNFSFIDHAKPNCQSNELFKGVLDDQATGAFTGRVLVRKDAQRTNAYQSNNNILLTNSAKINSKPQLEIYADDVKCSHGATVGQLDENAMFYLRTRGLGKEEARILLMYAFAYEVIEKIRVEPLKEQIRELVERRFRGELDKCDSCVVCGQIGNNTSCL
jgi:Fe-S cluster assembly protein SufD